VPELPPYPASSLVLMAGPPHELIGPFPPGVDPVEYDKLRRRVLWKMPYGLYVVGSRSSDGQRRQLMTANWLTQVSFDPKVLAVSIEVRSLTHELIVSGACFTVNIVDRQDRAIVRRFTKPVEVDLGRRTLNGFAFHDAPSGAPLLDQALAWLDCRVTGSVDVGGHTLFLGEVTNGGFQKPEDTEALRMEDTRMNYGG
jgi:flavin reductase (DIM6/NTAB) family NADH-FMN oxidoreductase RutF